MLSLNWIRMSIKKGIKNFFILTIPTLVVCFIILELFFRLGIKASNPPRLIINKKDNLITLDTNHRTGRYTYGSFTEVNATWRVNNFGWNYPNDYFVDSSKPLIAVIGDSYIEALQVDSDENYPYLLHKRFNGERNVFAFGMEGAPLSQYLEYTRYVKKYFKPSMFIINLCHNDFEESIKELYPTRNLFTQVSIRDSNIIEIPAHLEKVKLPLDNWWVNFFYKSALVRYVYRNTYIIQNIKKLFGSGKADQKVRADLALKNEPVIKLATKKLIEKIVSENSGISILFVFDAPRMSIYDKSLDSSNVIWMNKMVADICTDLRVDVLDLTQVMLEDYNKNGKKFNTEVDGHWNEYGHQFVENQVYNFIKSRGY